MSFQALAWAVDQKPKRPADKLLLLGLADRHNTENKLAWPSTKWLAEFSGLDRKTVLAGLKRLQEAGSIIDSGQRFGKTKQVIGYSLAFDTARERMKTHGNARELKGSQKRNGSVFPRKGSQKRDTEPIKEPVNIPIGGSAGAKHICPDDFWPEPKAGSVTFSKTEALAEAERLEEQVEKFIAHHQTRENKYKNWQQCWTTWVTNNFDRVSKYDRQNGSGDNQAPSNPMVRAAAQREAQRRSEEGSLL